MTIEERKPCIYKATSKTTGKSYIGQSKDGLNHRRNSHYSNAFNKHSKTEFATALRELGKEDFSWSILKTFECNNRMELQNQLNHYERYFIAQYNSFREGYNENEGGNGGLRYKYKNLEEKNVFRKVGMRLRREARPEFKQQRKEYRKQKEEANPELKEERNNRHKEYMKQNQQSRRLAKKAKLGQEAYREAYNERRRQRKLKQQQELQKESLNS